MGSQLSTLRWGDSTGHPRGPSPMLSIFTKRENFHIGEEKGKWLEEKGQKPQGEGLELPLLALKLVEVAMDQSVWPGGPENAEKFSPLESAENITVLPIPWFTCRMTNFRLWPIELSDNKCVLFEAAEIIAICWSNTRQYTVLVQTGILAKTKAANSS